MGKRAAGGSPRRFRFFDASEMRTMGDFDCWDSVGHSNRCGTEQWRIKTIHQIETGELPWRTRDQPTDEEAENENRTARRLSGVILINFMVAFMSVITYGIVTHV